MTDEAPARSPAHEIADGPRADPVPHFQYIDALRGWAFLMVAVTHAGVFAALKYDGVEGLVAGACQSASSGVQLFYLMSALTLFQSLDARAGRDRSPVAAFFARRFFRIAPLFWSAIVFYLWWNGLGSRHYAPEGISPAFVGLTAAFLHGWHPYSINSVVPGGWSIGVEMMFYLTVPALYRHFRTPRRQFVLLCVTLSVAFACRYKRVADQLYPGCSPVPLGDFAHFWLPNQMPVFAMGLLLYSLAKATRPGDDGSIRVELAPLGWAMGGLAVASSVGAMNLVGDHIIWSTAFCLMAWGLSIRAVPLMVNGFVRFVGKVSFSAYLVHFVAVDAAVRVLGLSNAPVLVRSEACERLPVLLHLAPMPGLARLAVLLSAVLLITLPVSALTYRFIEKPGNSAGRWLIRTAGWGK